jgi:universal stress protein E
MTKILVVIDPREENHSALERCKEINPEEDLQLHVCMFVDADSARELANTLKERTQWLDEQVKPYIDLGYDITKEVTSFARLHESIIQIALKVKADLIFKPMRKHSIVRRAVLTSTDWNLIRFCPAPVLLVSDQEVIRGKPVVAAIDVCNADEKHAELNHTVLDQATVVAEVVESKVHCVNAWNVSSAVMAAGSIDPTPYEIAHAKKNDHLEASKALCGEYNIPSDRIIVEEGTAEFVINTAAEELGAGLLVIGTVARRGISGLFIGNTAEAVLEGSSIDILVVKQADFECPLDL